MMFTVSWGKACDMVCTRQQVSSISQKKLLRRKRLIVHALCQSRYIMCGGSKLLEIVTMSTKGFTGMSMEDEQAFT